MPAAHERPRRGGPPLLQTRTRAAWPAAGAIGAALVVAGSVHGPTLLRADPAATGAVPARAGVAAAPSAAMREGSASVPSASPSAAGPRAALPASAFAGPPPCSPPRPPHPLAGLSDAELERRLDADPASLPTASLGQAAGGALWNGVQLPEHELWVRQTPALEWTTPEVIGYLEVALSAVRASDPAAPPLPVGHISAERGGRLSPHLSHQAGRDVDINYFLTDDDARWYVRAHAGNFDAARNWRFVRALLLHTDVEMLIIDASLQTLLRAEAERVGEPAAWLDSVFRGAPGEPAIIRHFPGHATHMHIRFFSPEAQETGRRLHPLLVERGVISEPVRYVVHRVRKGETLTHLSRRYGASIREIQRANGLRGTVIVAGTDLRVPQSAGIAALPPVTVPPRRAPPGACVPTP